MEAQRGKARRPHHKSRTGCVQCKQRKIKCDEQKPVCKKCSLYGTSCSFLQTYPLQSALPPVRPISEPSDPVSRLPTIESMLSPAPLSSNAAQHSANSQYLPPSGVNFSILDMELLHFFTTTSVFTYIDSYAIIELFRITVIRIAFEYPFLMHAILSMSALHLSKLRPEKRAIYQHASDNHTATALSLFQPEIGNLNPVNCHACFAFSSCLFTLAWASQDIDKPSTMFFPSSVRETGSVNIQWIKLQRGTNSILHNVFPLLAEGPLSSVFLPWKDLDPNRDDPLPPEEEAIFADLPMSWRLSPLSQADKEVLENTHNHLKRVFSMLLYNPEVSKLATVMTWLSSIRDEFLVMMERKVPQALLLTILFCVSMRTVEKVWWMEGKAKNLQRTLIAVLGGGWERWTTWPIERVLGEVEWMHCQMSGL